MLYLSFTFVTHNTVFLILRAKGYKLTVAAESQRCGLAFVAETSECRFAANGGAELLGLVTIWEHFGEKWNVQQPDIVGEVMVEGAE